MGESITDNFEALSCWVPTQEEDRGHVERTGAQAQLQEFGAHLNDALLELHLNCQAQRLWEESNNRRRRGIHPLGSRVSLSKTCLTDFLKMLDKCGVNVQ
jgi:hypothetical protein